MYPKPLKNYLLASIRLQDFHHQPKAAFIIPVALLLASLSTVLHNINFHNRVLIVYLGLTASMI